MRSGTATKSRAPGVVVRATKSTIDFFAAPSFHDSRKSGWATAAGPATSSALATTNAERHARRCITSSPPLLPPLLRISKDAASPFTDHVTLGYICRVHNCRLWAPFVAEQSLRWQLVADSLPL